MPFDHVVVVMMENHSFDNLLGALARSGQPAADGLSFDSAGRATNTNPGAGSTPATVTAFAFSSTAQGPHVSQTWNATHEQIDGGKMDGFVRSVNATQPMGYYPREVLPFAYDLAATFTLANRWFCSAPCQTFPNRRFLMAGTGYGDIATDARSLADPPPPNGTIFDRLHRHGISWRNYFTDLPYTAIIPSIVEKYPGNLATLDDFFEDCAKGSLPSVSFVDPEVGVVSLVGKTLASLPVLGPIIGTLSTVGGDEEAPQDMYYGEAWATAWSRPSCAHPPGRGRCSCTPMTSTAATTTTSRPRRPSRPTRSRPSSPPAMSPAAMTSRPAGARRHRLAVRQAARRHRRRPDHTSVLATIEAKWNLPALTYRDANAATVMDFLDPTHATFATPPPIQGPSLTGPSGPAA